MRNKSDSQEQQEPWGTLWIFFAWCLQREAFFKWNYLVLLAPLVISGLMGRVSLGFQSDPGQAKEIFASLVTISLFFVFASGVGHAAKAVCWEVSRELRDLVRLTGIHPRTLLWCRTISRWWTIGLSIFLVLPMAMFVRTVGGGSADQWFAGGCWLLLATLLTAGFAIIGSVSSGHASNPEAVAATAAILLMLFYHFIFWGFSAIIWILIWLTHGTFFPPNGSIGTELAYGSAQLAPIYAFYRANTLPDSFSPFAPSFWMHLPIGFISFRMASIVMQNRFRVTKQGDQDLAEVTVDRPKQVGTQQLRPQCGDRPHFWKDTYILGNGVIADQRWTAFSLLGVIGVLGSFTFGHPIASAIFAICLAPCFVAVRFDSSFTAEFRDKTWSALLLLPVDPRDLVLVKIQSAVWARRALIWPVGIACFIGALSHPTAILMALAMSFVVGALFIEVSILSQLNQKIWWAGLIVAAVIIFLIIFTIAVWINFQPLVSFWITMVTLTVTAIGGYLHIDWRLSIWSEG